MAVVGGGIIGLAVAWQARRRGMDVVVYEREPEFGRGATTAAAGMLAPVSEADAQERELLEFNLKSARMWPGFAAELKEASGIDPGYLASGALMIGLDRDGAEHVERERDLRERLGLRVERMLGSEARRRESALAPTLRLACHAAEDNAVEPARAVAALVEACRRSGVDLRPGTPVADHAALDAERVVIAAGAWSAELADGVPVRPVKGQAIRLRDPNGPGLCGSVLRWWLPTPGYLVPRGDGRYYLGATMEERGFDTSVTALALHELLRDAADILPGVLELEVEETLAGLRPGTPDNAPILGADPRNPRIVWATGHFRNGILLTPATAEVVVAELCGERPGHPFGVERFARAAA